MPLDNGKVVALVSIAFLLIPLALGSYALGTIRAQSLPISKVLGAFTVALPIVAGAVLQPTFSASSLVPGNKHRNSSLSRWFPINVLILLVYETAVASLAGTHIGPSSSLRCGLDERWRSLYHLKDADAVRRIQDTFKCCGLHSVVDMAWPFPGHGVGPEACKVNHSRNKSCFESWRGEEQKIAGLMLMVPLLVFIWKAVMTWFWLSRSRLQAYLPREEESENAERALDYHNANHRYLDEPPAGQGSARDTETNHSGHREAEQGAQNTESLLDMST